MIVLIDNYDSFSYNLVQLAGGFNTDIRVVRNDEMTVEDIRALNPSHIILSPGPGYPKNAGVCESLIEKMGGEIPIMGVCLGHQAICEVFGAEITHAVQLMHGKTSRISIDNTNPIFKDLPSEIEAARYHSLIAKRFTIPEELEVIAEDGNGEVMAVRHRHNAVYGVQFHPESILTPKGKIIMQNFLSLEDGKND